MKPNSHVLLCDLQTREPGKKRWKKIFSHVPGSAVGTERFNGEGPCSTEIWPVELDKHGEFKELRPTTIGETDPVLGSKLTYLGVDKVVLMLSPPLPEVQVSLLSLTAR